jgi:hypothetical protein
VTDLWDAASEDHEVLAKQAAHALADAELESVLPFLLAARTPDEFAHRAGLAADSIRSIAARCGLDESELLAVAQRRYALMREALQEGVSILDETVEETHGQGSGPEKPDEHDQGPDFSHGYSEVPAGPPGGPDPQVTQVRQPAMFAPQQGVEASRRTAADGQRRTEADPGFNKHENMAMHLIHTHGYGNDQIRHSYDDLRAEHDGLECPPRQASRQAAADPASMMTQPYGGASSGMSSANMPAGTGQGAGAGPVQDTTPASDEATSGGLEDFDGTGSAAGVSASVKDPVRRRVAQVAASIRSSNPQLPAAECQRVARLVVGRYLQADLNSSVMGGGSVEDAAPDGGGQQGGHGGMSGLEEYGLGKSLISAAPELLAAL